MLSRKFGALLLGVGTIIAGEAVHAQTAPQLGTTPTARFQELMRSRTIVFSALPPVASAATEPLLINGVPVDPRQFPTLFRMTTGGTCTATLVGQTALLTAAHCVANGALIQFVLGERQIRGLCEHARGYDPQFNKSEDWALCLLEFPVVGINYETVAATGPTTGKRVVLTGFGCTQQGGPLDGKLRVGISETVDGQTMGFPAETSTIYTKSTIAEGGAVLCPGDSGGPLFVVSGNSFNDARSLVGVNSRTTFQFGVSLFAATASVAGRQFFRDWTERHGQKMCGINEEQNCR
jgi:Trypsin